MRTRKRSFRRDCRPQIIVRIEPLLRLNTRDALNGAVTLLCRVSLRMIMLQHTTNTNAPTPRSNDRVFSYRLTEREMAHQPADLDADNTQAQVNAACHPHR
jgi:hypothetical protein